MLFGVTLTAMHALSVVLAAVLGALLGLWSARLAHAYDQGLAAGEQPNVHLLTAALKKSRQGPARAAAPSALILALSLAWACMRHGWSVYLVTLACAAFVLCALALIDWRTGLLPDALTYPLIAVGILVAALPISHLPLYAAILGAVVGFCFLWLLTSIFRLIRNVDGMGRGDFKLAAALGAWCGVYNLLTVLFLASLAGVLFSMWHQRTLRPSGAYPFGPFLAGAGLIVLLNM